MEPYYSISETLWFSGMKHTIKPYPLDMRRCLERILNSIALWKGNDTGSLNKPISQTFRRYPLTLSDCRSEPTMQRHNIRCGNLISTSELALICDGHGTRTRVIRIASGISSYKPGRQPEMTTNQQIDWHISRNTDGRTQTPI